MTTTTIPLGFLPISGGYELLVVGIAFVVIFSNRLPRWMRKLGRALGQVRGAAIVQGGIATSRSLIGENRLG